jgi:hypothetical protein
MGRRRGAIAVGAVAALAGLVLPAAASAACGGVRHARAAPKRTPGRAPLVIGDSVLLGAVRQVAHEGYELDTRGCRQMGEGLRVIRARRRAGTLPRFVVLMLGTNWTIEPSQIRRGLRIVGSRRVLGLVTPREEGGGSGSDARVVRAAGRRYRGRVVVLDWVAYSAGHGGWFAPDGIHLGPGGAAGLARLLRRGLDSVYPPVERWRRRGRPAAADRVSPR